MSDVNRLRRFYLMNRIEAHRQLEFALRDVWRAKQEAEPGTALAAGFPAKSLLAAAGYTTVEDIDGADCAELEDYAALSTLQARTVLAALPPI